MKIQYLLLIALMLPTAPALAADGDSAGNNSGFRWGKFAENCGEKIIVGVVVGVAVSVTVTMIKEWLTPNDVNDSLLKRDKALENTRQHVKDLLHIANTTSNKELAAACRKNAEFGEQLLAQGITFRNKEFAKLCSKENQLNPFERKTPGSSDTAPTA